MKWIVSPRIVEVIEGNTCICHQPMAYCWLHSSPSPCGCDCPSFIGPLCGPFSKPTR